MKKLLSCVFSLDNGCVERCCSDRSMFSSNYTAVENSIETNADGYAEQDQPAYGSPLEYAEFVLSGELDGYLKRVSGPYSGMAGTRNHKQDSVPCRRLLAGTGSFY